MNHYRVTTNQIFSAGGTKYRLLMLENGSSYGARSAMRKWSFIAIRSEKVAEFSIYSGAVTFIDLATENILSNNQN